MLLGNLCAKFLGRSLLTGKDTIRAGEGAIATSRGVGTIRAGQDFNAASSINKFWNTEVLSKWT